MQEINGFELPQQAMTHLPDVMADDNSDVLGLWYVYESTGTALAVLTGTSLRVYGLHARKEWLFTDLERVDFQRPSHVTVRPRAAKKVRLTWESEVDFQNFQATYLAARTPRDQAPSSTGQIGANFVTTLPTFPGYTIERVHGVVSEIGSAAGLTASMKGSTALESAMSRLCASGGAMGANAIIGLQVSAFGARGGVTSVAGGDAVGVVLVATAVTITAMDTRSPNAHDDATT